MSRTCRKYCDVDCQEPDDDLEWFNYIKRKSFEIELNFDPDIPENGYTQYYLDDQDRINYPYHFDDTVMEKLDDLFEREYLYQLFWNKRKEIYRKMYIYFFTNRFIDENEDLIQDDVTNVDELPPLSDNINNKD